ncbi:hypothetical protein F0C08_01205 [Salmonella enterica]|uniref:Uncharacterized protein n=1 Tax=Salmonella enterica subsp. enterica serovar Bareilly TaxID=58096 RepID=A0A5V9XYN2_SALET|nr:hypothetical protein [Salmonella enterica]EBP3229645.1 hypothetical protein [Salmonella enterica subsp. enterica]EBV8121576.1 hypothetical protein [Salmonella enterica subsp. enterica serovar Bareilly]EDC7362340.1 hypothetical protein [Salmonella enterica subsp. enterica serovar Enteritidis]EAB2007856.1 hypothetical protein [Salmonella enterica]
MTNNNENLAASKKHTTTEYFIDKKSINKNIALVYSYYIGIYSMKRQKCFMISLPTITLF